MNTHATKMTQKEWLATLTPEYREQYQKELNEAVAKTIHVEKKLGETFKEEFSNAHVYGRPFDSDPFERAKFFVDREIDRNDEELTEEERDKRIEENAEKYMFDSAVDALVSLLDGDFVWSFPHKDENGNNFSFGQEHLEDFVKSLAVFGGLAFTCLDECYPDDFERSTKGLKKALYERLKKDFENAE